MKGKAEHVVTESVVVASIIFTTDDNNNNRNNTKEKKKAITTELITFGQRQRTLKEHCFGRHICWRKT